MKKIRLYLVFCYEAYRADEVGKRWVIDKPKDTLYYKYEIIDEADFILPKGFEVCEIWGDNHICYNGMPYDLLTTNNDDVLVITNDSGTFTLKKA